LNPRANVVSTSYGKTRSHQLRRVSHGLSVHRCRARLVRGKVVAVTLSVCPYFRRVVCGASCGVGNRSGASGTAHQSEYGKCLAALQIDSLPLSIFFVCGLTADQGSTTILATIIPASLGVRSFPGPVVSGALRPISERASQWGDKHGLCERQTKASTYVCY
jgi:hypothetical protein